MQDLSSLHVYGTKAIQGEWLWGYTDFCDRIFCAKSKFKGHILCLQVDSCNASNHSVIDNRQGVLIITGKMRENIQKTLHSGVALMAHCC